MEGVEGQGIHTGKESKMQFKYIQDKSKGFSLKKKNWIRYLGRIFKSHKRLCHSLEIINFLGLEI